MGRTVRELLASIDSAELTEWMAFERLEPFGDLHADFRAGSICAALVNLHVPEGKPALRPADFMPALAKAIEAAKPPVLAKTPEDQSNLLDAVLFGVAQG